MRTFGLMIVSPWCLIVYGKRGERGADSTVSKWQENSDRAVGIVDVSSFFFCFSIFDVSSELDVSLPRILTPRNNRFSPSHRPPRPRHSRRTRGERKGEHGEHKYSRPPPSLCHNPEKWSSLIFSLTVKLPSSPVLKRQLKPDIGPAEPVESSNHFMD